MPPDAGDGAHIAFEDELGSETLDRLELYASLLASPRTDQILDLDDVAARIVGDLVARLGSLREAAVLDREILAPLERYVGRPTRARAGSEAYGELARAVVELLIAQRQRLTDRAPMASFVSAAELRV